MLDRNPRLSFPELRCVEAGEPVLICRNLPNIGNSYSIAIRQPSMRRDVVKLIVYDIIGDGSEYTQVTETETHRITDGKMEFEAFEPRSSKEYNTCINVLKRHGVEGLKEKALI